MQINFGLELTWQVCGHLHAKLRQQGNLIFRHPNPKHPKYSPHKWLGPAYLSKDQYTNKSSKAPKLDKKDITRIQIITDTLLYYSQAVDTTMLTSLNEIASQQAAPTIDTF